VLQHGPDGEFANGLSGLGGKRAKPDTKADQTYDWVIDRVTRLIVKPNVGPITPVASRMTRLEPVSSSGGTFSM
jgi:hypothetical protein